MMLKTILPYTCIKKKTSNVENVMSFKTCLHTFCTYWQEGHL